MMSDIISKLTETQQQILADAIAAGANEAHFTYADGSFHRYKFGKDLAELERGMQNHHQRRLGLRLVKATGEWKWQVVGRLPFWNSFVDERIIFYNSQ